MKYSNINQYNQYDQYDNNCNNIRQVSLCHKACEKLYTVDKNNITDNFNFCDNTLKNKSIENILQSNKIKLQECKYKCKNYKN